MEFSTIGKTPLGIVAAALSDDARLAAGAARAAGFDGLQFDALTSALDLTKLSQTGRREFSQFLRQQNQRLVGLRTSAGPRGLTAGADLDRLLARWDSVLETAAGLQSPLICLDVGNLPGTENAQVDAALSELGHRADRYSVVVALRSDLAGFAAVLRALKAAACPWFGLDLDPVSALHEEQPIAQTIGGIANLIRHVRGRDALLGADRRTHSTPIGEGSVDWLQLLKLLNEAGYSGWISIDPMELTDRRAGAAAGLKNLKGI